MKSSVKVKETRFRILSERLNFDWLTGLLSGRKEKAFLVTFGFSRVADEPQKQAWGGSRILTLRGFKRNETELKSPLSMKWRLETYRKGWPNLIKTWNNKRRYFKTNASLSASLIIRDQITTFWYSRKYYT